MRINIILVIAMLLPLGSFAANKPIKTVNPVNSGFKITGSVKELLSEKIYLEYRTTGEDGYGITHLDSTLSYDGNFTFSGELKNPVYADLRSDDGTLYYRFWLENSDIKVEGVNMRFTIITGSKTEDEFQLFNKITDIEPIRKEVIKVNEQIAEATANNKDKEEIKLLSDRNKGLVDKWEANAEKFVKDHPDSYVSLNHIWNKAMLDKLTYDKLARMFNCLTEAVKQSQNGRILAERIAIMKTFTVGQHAPNYSHPTLSGDTLSIADYRGKYLFFTFAATWVEEYRKDNPTKRSLYEKYHNQGLEIADVVLDRKLEDIQKMISDDQITWKILCDFKGWGTAAVKTLVIDHIPQNILIGPDGIVLGQNLNGEQLEKLLNEKMK